MKRRSTIQKELVKNAVFELKSHITADAVYEFIKKEHPTIGKGTVYRNLGILAEQGVIRKLEIPDGPDCFDYVPEKHHHVKCVKCGKLFNVDIMEMPDFLNSVKNTNGVKILDYDIYFKGICADCEKL